MTCISCISLNKPVNCDYICKEIMKQLEKHIKSKEQAENSVLQISLVEVQDYQEIKKIN